jgi:hypothetical protein
MQRGIGVCRFNKEFDVGSCGNCNEPLDSAYGREFLVYRNKFQFLEVELGL